MKKSSIYPLLMDKLKEILRRKKIRYSRLSEELEMSESSIKRLLNEKDGSLSKIEAICQCAEVSFVDLINECHQGKAEELILTKEQDSFFAEHTHYFYFFLLLFEERMPLKKITAQFGLSKQSVNIYLKKLDDLGLIEWQSGNKIKMEKQKPITPPKNTKLGSKLTSISISNFLSLSKDDKQFKKTFGEEGNYLRLSENYIRPETAKEFKEKLQHLVQAMDLASERERRIYEKENLQQYTYFISTISTPLYYEKIPNLI